MNKNDLALLLDGHCLLFNTAMNTYINMHILLFTLLLN
jgi:hypothetical protein